MRYRLQTTTIAFLLLFACTETNDYDVAISDLENRLVKLNNQISSLNLDINRLDSTINNQLKLLTDSTFRLTNNLSNMNEVDSIDKYKKIHFINPEELFKEKFTISSLSVLTCTLRNIDQNQIHRFYKKEWVEINNNNILEQYSILEINKLERYIKVKSINYNKEFIVYMDMAQE